MTGPSVEDVIADVLLDAGAGPGDSLHSWRCKHPAQYGPCTCVAETVADVVAAIRAMTVDQQAELLDGYVEVPVLNEPLRRPVGPWRRVEP